jgi:phosphinothricin acetyltransferase
MEVRPADERHASQIADIYDHYIASSHATFEIEPVTTAEMLRRIEAGRTAGYPFLVCEEVSNEGIAGTGVVGYAYGHQYRPRHAYLHSIEVSVYIKPGNEGRHIGTALYTKLFDEIKSLDFHTIIAGISLPNNASVALHEKFGFTKVAHFHQVGRKFGRWIDVGYWQLIPDK